ncbi:hypothetical protein PBI_JACE_66 [Gordonia phage Jace]|uniref:Uncharacterized protein n=1 Tax=Gordonia phage Jace TaxID=2182360 RepID=A0A2U8UJQ1_9CAUD|nr:hypothetical protein HOT28_gp66 [Gordonia phage Jace]AWN03686.1 hypothetical protein PBI_JACE_66 [Gordonia phage Jace]
MGKTKPLPPLDERLGDVIETMLPHIPFATRSPEFAAAAERALPLMVEAVQALRADRAVTQ